MIPRITSGVVPAPAITWRAIALQGGTIILPSTNTSQSCGARAVVPTNAPILNTGRMIVGAEANVLPENARPTPRGAPIRLHTGVISVPVVGTVT